MTLMKEIISIPERVHQGDFVLKPLTNVAGVFNDVAGALSLILDALRIWRPAAVGRRGRCQAT